MILEIQDFTMLLRKLSSCRKYQSKFWFTLDRRMGEGYVMVRKRLIEPKSDRDQETASESHVTSEDDPMMQHPRGAQEN